MGSIRKSKTKRRTRSIYLDYLKIQEPMLIIGRDLDQVHADLRSSKHLLQHKTVKPVEDLPGLGQWYCVECAKWFEGENSLVQHRRGKNHKRRVRSLREEPYAQKEAEAAVGLYTDNGPRREVDVNNSVANGEVMEVEAAEAVQ